MESDDQHQNGRRCSQGTFGSFQSPIMNMATPLLRDKSTSEKNGGVTSPVGSLPTYFTRVYEANEPEVVIYSDNHIPGRPPIIHSASAGALPLETKTESAPLIVNGNNRETITPRQKLLLVAFISVLVTMVISCIVIYSNCLDKPTISLRNFIRAELTGKNNEVLDCLFIMKAENDNIQDINISSMDIKVCFRYEPSSRSIRPAEEPVCLGFLHNKARITISPRSERIFDLVGHFNLTDSQTSGSVIRTLKEGNFIATMEGSAFYNTLTLLKMHSHIETSTHVLQPLLP